MTGAKSATGESFLLIAPALKAQIPAMIGKLKEAGLKIEKQLELELSAAETEALLFGITTHLRSKAPTVPIETIRARKYGLETTRRFGTEAFVAGAAVPSLEDVEMFTTGGPVSAIILRHVDPRVNVVSVLHTLVGPHERDAAGAAKACLRATFDLPDHLRVWRLAAPAEPDSAVRSLQLLRRYHDAATATIDGSGAPAGSGKRPVSRGAMSRLERRASMDLSVTTASMRDTAHLASQGVLSRLTIAGPFPPGTTQGKSPAVDVDQLLDFCFPPGQQWPNSTGRLILVATYGPLTADGHLNGGRRVGRHLTDYEVESMIKEIERDDLLAVYTAGSVIGDIEQLLADIRAASRRLPRMSRDQVMAMLADLPRDSGDRISFHDLQQRALKARMDRVAELGKMFPDIIAKRDPEVARLAIAKAPKPFGKGTLQRRLKEEAALGTTIAAGGSMAAAATQGLGSFKALMAATETQRRSTLMSRSFRQGHGHGGSGAGGLNKTGGGGGTVSFALPGESMQVSSSGRASSPTAAEFITRARSASPTAGGTGLTDDTYVSPTGRRHLPRPIGAGTGSASLFPASHTFDRAPRAKKASHDMSEWSGGLDTSVKMGDVQRSRRMEQLVHINMSKVVDIDIAGKTSSATATKASSLILRPDLPSAKDGFNRFAPLGLHKPHASFVPGGLTRHEMVLTKILDTPPRARPCRERGH